MSDTSSNDARTEVSRSPASGVQTLWMLMLGPILIAIGAFVTIAMRPWVSTISSDSGAILMAWTGLVALVVGAVLLTAGIVLQGIRSLLSK